MMTSTTLGIEEFSSGRDPLRRDDPSDDDRRDLLLGALAREGDRSRDQGREGRAGASVCEGETVTEGLDETSAIGIG